MKLEDFVFWNGQKGEEEMCWTWIPYFTFRLEGRRINNTNLSQGKCAPVKHNRIATEQGDSELG